MVRLTCANPKCRHEWERKTRWSRGQLIRCPSCRMVLGQLSKPIKPHVPIKYMNGKAIDEYAKV